MSRARTVQQVQSARATRDGLTEAQDDGRACIVCGAEGRPMVPTGARGSRGAQLFECWNVHRKGAACYVVPLTDQQRVDRLAEQIRRNDATGARVTAADLAARCDECGVLTVGLLRLEELFAAIADASTRGES